MVGQFAYYYAILTAVLKFSCANVRRRLRSVRRAFVDRIDVQNICEQSSNPGFYCERCRSISVRSACAGGGVARRTRSEEASRDLFFPR